MQSFITETKSAEFTTAPEQIGDTKFHVSHAGKKCALKTCDKAYCQKPWHTPCMDVSSVLVKKLWSLVLMIGITEILVGITLNTLVLLSKDRYDQLYGTQHTRAMSRVTIIGLLLLTLSSVILLVSLIRNLRRMMWLRIMLSTAIGIYIFILSVLQIHYALLMTARDINAAAVFRQPTSSSLSAGCFIGIFSLFATVIHFTGNMAVFTYYNFRYIHPVIFRATV